MPMPPLQFMALRASTTRTTIQHHSTADGPAGSELAAASNSEDSQPSCSTSAPTQTPTQDAKRKAAQRHQARRVVVGDPTPAGPLPPLEQCRHFVNLTNGIEALPTLQVLGLQVR